MYVCVSCVCFVCFCTYNILTYDTPFLNCLTEPACAMGCRLAFLFFIFVVTGPACNGVGCGEDLESTDDLKRPQRFDNDPLAAPVTKP